MHTSTASVPITVLLYDDSLLCSNVAILGLIEYIQTTCCQKLLLHIKYLMLPSIHIRGMFVGGISVIIVTRLNR